MRAAIVLGAALLAMPAAAATYQIDQAHTYFGFAVSRLDVVDVYGRFNQFEGTIVYDEADPAQSSVQITIRTESLDTGNERRDNHLRSPDFFNAVQFPVITFKSTSIKPVSDSRFEVTGDLSLHGVTKAITFEVEHTKTIKNPMGEGNLIGFKSQLQLKRSDFGMNYMPGAIGDEVKIVLAVQGIGE